jgi:hypothetical protein
VVRKPIDEVDLEDVAPKGPLVGKALGAGVPVVRGFSRRSLLRQTKRSEVGDLTNLAGNHRAPCASNPSRCTGPVLFGPGGLPIWCPL